jgi:surface protein
MNLNQITTFDSTNLNTSNVTNMSFMFMGCSTLTSLNLSNFDTSKVTTMTFMFSRCTSLKSVDLSSFDTSQTLNMSYMFYKCSSLKTIYVSELWSTSIIKDIGLNGSDMFTDCNKLVGAIPYDSSKTSVKYANYTTGYLRFLFTFKYHDDRFVITGSDLNRIAKVIRKKIGSIDGLSFPEGFITALESIGIVSSDDGSGNVIVNMTGTTVSHDNGNVVIS